MSSDIISLQPIAFGLGAGDSLRAIAGTRTSGPPGVEAIIEYNGLYLNVREWIDTFIISSIDGVDDADVRDAREVNPGSHGETPGSAFYGGRTIVLSGYIQTKTIWKMRDMQMALRQAFSQIDRELPLIFRTGMPGQDLAIWCKKSQKITMQETQQTMNSFRRDFQIMLRASNPRFLSMSRERALIGFSSTLTEFGDPVQTLEENFTSSLLTTYPSQGGGYEVVNGLLIPKSYMGERNLLSNPAFNNGDLTDWQIVLIDGPVTTSGYWGSAMGSLAKSYTVTAEDTDGWIWALRREHPQKVTPGSKLSAGALCYISNDDSGMVSLRMSWFQEDGETPSATPTTDSEINYPGSGPDIQLSWQGIDVPADAHYARLEVWINCTGVEYTIFIGKLMLQDKATLSEYFDGSNPNQFIGPTMWEGPDFLSPSRVIRQDYVNYVTDPRLIYGVVGFTASGGDFIARDDGQYKYGRFICTDPGEGSVWIEANPFEAGGKPYSMGVWLKSPGTTPRNGSLELDFFDGFTPIGDESGSLLPPVTSAWRFYKLENVKSPDDTNGLTGAVIIQSLPFNAAVDIRGLTVTQGEDLPPEGSFDGDDPWVEWEDEEGPGVSIRHQYTQVLSLRQFKSSSNTIAFTIPPELDNEDDFDSGEAFDYIRVIGAYIDDLNMIYAEISPSGIVNTYVMIDGEKEQINGSPFNFAPQLVTGSTFYLRIRCVEDVVLVSRTIDADLNVDPYQTAAGQIGHLTPEQRAKFIDAMTPVGFAIQSRYAGWQIKQWRFEDADEPIGFDKIYNAADVYVKDGKLRQLSNPSTGVLLKRNDIPYPIADCVLTLRHVNPAVPVGYAEQIRIMGKILSANRFPGGVTCVYAELRKLGTGTDELEGTAELGVGFLVDGSPATPFDTYLDMVEVADTDVPIGEPMWLRLIIVGDTLTAEHWLEEPSEEGEPAATVTHEMTEPETEMFQGGVPGDVGIAWSATPTGNVPSASWLDNFKIFINEFDSIAFSVINKGNFPAQPEIYLHGPFEECTIVNEVNDQAIILTDPIPEDETWVIDVARNQMYRESDGESRFDALDETSDMIELEPGVNPIRVIATGLQEASQVEFFYQHTIL